MTTIRCLRPTIAIAIGFEVERTGQFECFTHALLDFGLDPVKTLGVDGIFKAGVQPLLAVAIVALHSHDGIRAGNDPVRSEEHTSELQSLMRISYDVFCLKKKKTTHKTKVRNLTTKNKTNPLMSYQKHNA